MKTEKNLALNPNQHGFAPAVSPVAATTLSTDSPTIQSGETTVNTQGERMPAWYARPKKASGPLPVILVVQEIFGVHEHIRDICRRLAIAGYLAVAPELYFRQGNPADYHDINQLMNELVSKVPDTQVLADLDHVANWAAQHGGDMRNMAITGFCWGGRIVWLYAAHNPQLKAGVAWYGRLAGERTLQQPRHPIDITAELSAPVLGLYGAQDHSIPLDSVETMRNALQAIDVHTEIIVYPEAGHAFNADYRPSYHEPSARDGWQRMLAWFAQYGIKPEAL